MAKQLSVYIALVFCFLLQPPSAQAMVKDGVDFTEKVRIDGQELVLNGVGLRLATLLQIKVYIAGLYLKEKSKTTEAILNQTSLKRLRLQFLRSVAKDKLRTAWTEGFQKNCSSNCDDQLKYLNELNHEMVNMKPGDQLIFTFYPDRVEAEIRSKQITFASHDFGKTLLAIFIGKNPPNEALKKGLLGL